MLNVLLTEYKALNFNQDYFIYLIMDYVKESEGRECFAFFVLLNFFRKNVSAFVKHQNDKY